MLHRFAAAAACAVSFFTFCAPAGAQAVPLDLPAAVRYALEHSPNVLSRRATVENDEAQYARLHANELPPVTGTLQNQLSKSSNAAGSFQQFGLSQQNNFSQNTAQVGSTWTVYNGSNAQIQAQQAKRQIESARGDLQRAQQQLAQEVTNAYFAVSARRENVRLTTADRAYQQALLDVARANERVGRAAGVDVLRAQVNELRAESTLATAISDEATARETLAQAIGAPPDMRFAFPDVLPEPVLPAAPLASLVALAKANRSDIASARAQVAVARLADALIETDRRPQIQLTGAFGNQTSPTTLVQQQLQRDLQNQQLATLGQPLLPPVVPRGSPGFWQIGATSTFNLGFVDYGARHAQHRAARAGIDSAQATLTSTENAVETDVRQALRTAQTSAANLATAKQAAALGAESARIAQLQYRNGLISLTDATQAQQTNLQSQTDLANARVSYIGAVVHLRVAVGTSDPVAVVDMRNP
ncbi:MAG: TolC family protein [Candidatus Velthaea sp.]